MRVDWISIWLASLMTLTLLGGMLIAAQRHGSCL
jgi:hypothetical protein